MKKFILPLFVLSIVFFACTPPTYYMEYRVNNLTSETVMIIATPNKFETNVDTFFVSSNSCTTIFIDETSRNAKDGFADANLDSIWVTSFEIFKNDIPYNGQEKEIENWGIQDTKGTSYFTISPIDDDFN